MEREETSDESRQVHALIVNYAHAWTTILGYDEGTLEMPDGSPSVAVLDYDQVCGHLAQFKRMLTAKGEATELFGREQENALKRIIGSIDQTIFGDPVYGSLEEKAAHLLYFIIKDHPFTDGNKRIGAFLFLRYMQIQKIRLTISAAALTALALFVAASPPSDKDRLIRLIMSSIGD